VYKLAYTRWNGEKHDLYIGDTNGSSEQFIVTRAAGPSWSVDGRYIFIYAEEGLDQIFPGVTNGLARISGQFIPAQTPKLRASQGHGWNDGTARAANVSPDGTMIAYDGNRSGGRRIYFLGTDTNQQFRYELVGEQPDWSPDSQQVVYRSGRDNRTGNWISNRTDSGHRLLTNQGTDSFPAWSPNGQTIAFSRDVGGNVDIYIVNIDGSNLQRLTDAPGHDTLPIYLPDGDLVFRSARGGSWGIWKMKGDGSEQVEIIPNAPVGPEWAFSRMDVLP
jgi:Tol biopolymer transport system component